MEIPGPWKKVVYAWTRMPQQCRCGRVFTEDDNLGNWQCRQHQVPFDHIHGWWPCCRAGLRNPGCIAADHTPHPEPFTTANDIAGIPDAVVHLIQLTDRPGTMDGGSRIRRFDSNTVATMHLW